MMLKTGDIVRPIPGCIGSSFLFAISRNKFI